MYAEMHLSTAMYFKRAQLYSRHRQLFRARHFVAIGGLGIPRTRRWSRISSLPKGWMVTLMPSVSTWKETQARPSAHRLEDPNPIHGIPKGLPEGSSDDGTPVRNRSYSIPFEICTDVQAPRNMRPQGFNIDRDKTSRPIHRRTVKVLA